jgi:hypothetical protein
MIAQSILVRQHAHDAEQFMTAAGCHMSQSVDAALRTLPEFETYGSGSIGYRQSCLIAKGPCCAWSAKPPLFS